MNIFKKFILTVVIFISVFSFANFASAAITPGKINNNDSLKNGLVGYWSFDGPTMTGTSTALDSSGQGNNGNLRNGPVRKIGKIGQALFFDGVNDYVDLGDLDMPSSMTISAWVYLRNQSANSTWEGIVTKGETGDTAANNHNYLLAWNSLTALGSDGFTFFLEDNGATDCIADSAANEAAGFWYHIVGVFDDNNNRIKLYVNNVLKKDNACAITPNQNNWNAWIGDDNHNLGLPWDGLIDDVRIYNRALSADEIKRLYRMGATLKLNAPNNNASLKNGLVGYWSFDGADVVQNGTVFYALDKINNIKATSSGAQIPTKKEGIMGQALSFDGTANYLLDEIAPVTSKPITLCAWFKSRDIASRQTLVSVLVKGGSDLSALSLELRGDVAGDPVGAVSSDSAATGVRATSVSSYKLGTWAHACGVFLSNTARTIYFNGVLENTNTTSNAQSSLDRVVIGAFVSGSAVRLTNGLIDDVRVYNRSLSADEIKRLYRMGATLKLNAPNNNASLKNGLVGYWSFDGPTVLQNGTVFYALDKINNIKATSSGAQIPKKSAGKIGQALSFNGTANYLFDEIAPVTSKPITLCAWFKSYNIASQQTLVTVLVKGGSNLSGLALELRGDVAGDPIDAVSQNTIATAASARSVSSYKLGTWAHACGVFLSNTNRSIYFNGVLENTNTTSNAQSSMDRVVIGAFVSGSAVRLTNGLIDDVRIYNRSLSADEIKRLYNMGR